MVSLVTVAVALALAMLALVVRLVYLFQTTVNRRAAQGRAFAAAGAKAGGLASLLSSMPASASYAQKPSVMSVLGSGGHTAEMMALLARVDRRALRSLQYVIADTDATSRRRVQAAEDALGSGAPVVFATLPRSREVGQSFVSSVPTTLWASLFACRLVFKERPDILVVNGPGTCVPLCWAAFLLRVVGLRAPTIVFVESFARVRRLSLTGFMLYPIAQRFVVQWPQLAKAYPATEYVGVVC